MTKGVILFANNNDQIDYVRQAIFCAKQVQKYLKLPVSLVTDSAKHLTNNYPKLIDFHIIQFVEFVLMRLMKMLRIEIMITMRKKSGIIFQRYVKKYLFLFLKNQKNTN